MPQPAEQKNIVRTRFAPSPTGFLHVGGLRTALYNYLFAQKNNGTFILRIEDTDQTRFVEGAIENLLETLKEIGLTYNEGPYIQSKRTEIYRKYAQELLEKKSAYLCFCTAERLQEMREKQVALKKAPMYDRTCLNLTPDEIEKKKKQECPYVIRQKIPQGKLLKFHDLIRGKVSFDTSNIDDQVLMKSDHFPTYHLANVIDDHLMEISHVIRGEEWLPSTPKHLLLYEAFGWQPPQFAHIPLLLNKDKSKLSKRQGDVSVESYLKKGYIKEALINFIALLGWHPGKGIEKEIFTIEELIDTFSIEQVHKAGAIFDLEKLDWFNFQWKRKLHQEKTIELAKKIEVDSQCFHNEKGELICEFKNIETRKAFTKEKGKLLLAMCEQYLPKAWITPDNEELLFSGLITIEDKILKNPAQAAEQLRFYFETQEYPTELILNEKMHITKEIAQKSLEKSLEKLEQSLDQCEGLITKIQAILLNLAQELNVKNGQLLWPIRVVLTGEQYSPGVFELIWALGKKETLKRIKKGIQKLQDYQPHSDAESKTLQSAKKKA